MIKQSRKVEIILGLAKQESIKINEQSARQKWSKFLNDNVEDEFLMTETTQVNRLCGASLVLDIILTDIGYYNTIGNPEQPPLCFA